MKFSEWAKEYDSRNPGKLRVMNHKELLSITEWDNQPERSKREDLADSLIGSQKNVWGFVEIDQKFTEKDFENAKMRCSEHCGNTVREVQ